MDQTNSNIASREENLSAVASLALAHSQLAPRSDTRREVELLRLWKWGICGGVPKPHQWIDIVDSRFEGLHTRPGGQLDPIGVSPQTQRIQRLLNRLSTESTCLFT